jgi:hypothetical protein
VEFEEGELVMIFTENSKEAGTGKSAKLLPYLDGPYRIVKRLSALNYWVESTKEASDVVEEDCSLYLGVVDSDSRDGASWDDGRRVEHLDP